MNATVTVHSPSHLGVAGPATGAPFVAGDAKTAGALACGWSGATLDERGGCPASRVRYEVVIEPCADQNASYVRPPPTPGLPAADGMGEAAGVTEAGGARGIGWAEDAVIIDRSAASWESTCSVGCIGSKGSWKELFVARVWEEDGDVPWRVDELEVAESWDCIGAWPVFRLVFGVE